MVMSIAGQLIGTTNGVVPMNTFKHIAALVSIVAILGLSGCFWGRGDWNGHHYREGDHGSEHHYR